MRPIGHTEAREERATLIIDDPLQQAWGRYCAWSDDIQHVYADHGRAAIPLLAGVPLSQQILECFIIRNYQSDDLTGMRLGHFLTQAYQRLPDEEIVYALDTPAIEHLGHGLSGKRLVIEGTLGRCVGADMRGELVINGSVRELAGLWMIGSLVNNGHAMLPFGERMVGFLSQRGTLRDSRTVDDLFGVPGGRMIGFDGNEWHIEEPWYASLLPSRYQSVRNAFREDIERCILAGGDINDLRKRYGPRRWGGRW